MNFVSHRISNKYKKGFSLSHSIKYRHLSKTAKLAYDIENIIYYEGMRYEMKRDLNNRLIENPQTLEDKAFNQDIENQIMAQEKLLKEIRKYHKKEVDNRKKDYQEHNKRKMRSDANLNYRGIITFGNEEQNLSREEMNNQNQDLLDKCRHDTVKKTIVSLGLPEDTKYYIVKHLDEEQIHYHYEFIGYDFVNHSLIRRGLTQKKMIELQDIAGERYQDLDFHRGISKDKKIVDYCNENNLVYEDLSIEEKWEVKVAVGVKYQTTKDYRRKMNNATHKTEQQFNKTDLTITEIKKRVEDKSITLEEISELKEINKGNKLVKRFLDYRYKVINIKNTEESQSKSLKRLENTYDKMEQGLKDGTIIFNQIKEVVENKNKIIDSLDDKIKHNQELQKSFVNVNVGAKKTNKIKVNKINVKTSKELDNELKESLKFKERTEEEILVENMRDTEKKMDSFVSTKREIGAYDVKKSIKEKTTTDKICEDMKDFNIDTDLNNDNTNNRGNGGQGDNFNP